MERSAEVLIEKALLHGSDVSQNWPLPVNLVTRFVRTRVVRVRSFC
jgi:uncharacterized membrane protein YfbV (UPF0208 family)